MIHETWHEGLPCCDRTWEEAYARFETPEEEIAKFIRRFRRLGVPAWPREAAIVDLFCGRGNALVALERMGFTNLTGVDLSPHLLEQYRGPARLILGDCRDLRFAPGSMDYFTVQGGLHHLPRIPEDLEQCLAAIHRCLKPEGRLLIVEPWPTPFLRIVHAVCRVPLARRCSGKIAALHTMIEAELDTYSRWLASSRIILERVKTLFHPHIELFTLGKWMGVYWKK